jgi:hypothetical protein
MGNVERCKSCGLNLDAALVLLAKIEELEKQNNYLRSIANLARLRAERKDNDDRIQDHATHGQP